MPISACQGRSSCWSAICGRTPLPSMSCWHLRRSCTDNSATFASCATRYGIRSVAWRSKNSCAANNPGIDSRDWLPAAADVQVLIVEPLFCLLKSHYLKLRQRGPGRIGSGSDEPDPNGPADVSRPMPAVVERALAEGLRNADAPINAPSLRRLCQLSRDHGFRIKLALPPMPSGLESLLGAPRALTQLHEELNTILSTGREVDEICEFNRVRT